MAPQSSPKIGIRGDVGRVIYVEGTYHEEHHGTPAAAPARAEDRIVASEKPTPWHDPHLPRPAITLLVRARLTGLDLEVVALDTTGSTEHKALPAVALRNAPEPLVAEWFKRLGAARGSEAKAQALAALGAELGQQLLTDDLRRLLAEHAGAERTLWLLSDEPHIPWELVRVPVTLAGERRNLPPLAESFAMTRWVEGREPALEFPLRRIGVLVPSREGRTAFNDELAMIQGLARPGREIVEIPPRLDAVLNAVASGEFDGCHFCGHGHEPTGDPNLASIPLADRQYLTPQSLAGSLGRFAQRRPLVFLNGCHTARGGFTLTRMGGWPARFLEAGAGAFVGASWAVNGTAALRIAESFYRHLLAGEPLAQALRKARLEKDLPCSLTPWAYRGYGHPLARAARE